MIKECGRGAGRTILMATSGQGRDDWGLNQTTPSPPSSEDYLRILHQGSFLIREGELKLTLQNNPLLFTRNSYGGTISINDSKMLLDQLFILTKENTFREGWKRAMIRDNEKI